MKNVLLFAAIAGLAGAIAIYLVSQQGPVFEDGLYDDTYDSY